MFQIQLVRMKCCGYLRLMRITICLWIGLNFLGTLCGMLCLRAVIVIVTFGRCFCLANDNIALCWHGLIIFLGFDDHCNY